MSGGADGAACVRVSAAAVVELAAGRRHRLFHVNALGTLIHEAGQAVTACLTGGGVYCVQVSAPQPGVTHHWVPSRCSAIASAFAGYAIPPLPRLGAAALLRQGRASAVLTLTVAAVVALLSVTRDLLTLVCVLIVGVLTLVARYWGTDWLQTTLACVEAWVLLASDLGGVAALVPRRLHGQFADDAVELAALTCIPARSGSGAGSCSSAWCLWP